MLNQSIHTLNPILFQVGFVFVRLLDNGLSVVSRAGRVREDYEGRGIQKQLVAHVLQIYSPPARFQVATFRDTNEYLMQKRNTGQLNISFHRVCRLACCLTDCRYNTSYFISYRVECAQLLFSNATFFVKNFKLN